MQSIKIEGIDQLSGKRHDHEHFMRRALNEAEKVLLSGEFRCAQDPKHCFILDLFFESGQYLLEWKPFEKQHAFA